GNYGRMANKALRLAALFASLENKNLIEMKHWAKAQAITEDWRDCLHELYSQVNERPLSEIDSLKEVILQFLTTHPDKQYTIREMQQSSRHFKHVPSKEIEEALDRLEKDGVVDRKRSGKTQTYQIGGRK